MPTNNVTNIVNILVFFAMTFARSLKEDAGIVGTVCFLLRATPRSAITPIAVIIAIVNRHPKLVAMIKPVGTPRTVPRARPARTRERALPLFSSGTLWAATADDSGE